jgi:hypothetical protein
VKRCGLLLVLLAHNAWALDLPGKIGKEPLRLEVTETSILSQRFNAREGTNPQDQGWGVWLNKLNGQLSAGRFTVGLRLDSSLYWRTPLSRERCDGPDCEFKPSDEPKLRLSDSTRFRDQVYLAKIWASYKAPGVELTVGDAYVQFGRGLTLSLRKVDELGVDTTVRGIKVSAQKSFFAVQATAGFLNPTRVDEATGSALFPSKALPGDSRGSTPVYGSDRVYGAEFTVGRGLPIVLGTRAVRFTRCAPYPYDVAGGLPRTDTGFFSSPLGTCAEADVSLWLPNLPTTTSPVRQTDLNLVGQSVEVPNLWGHGSLYLEGAIQSRDPQTGGEPKELSGNALYGALNTSFGKLTSTFEVKSYRNFHPVSASIDSRVAAFGVAQYSSVPTVEPIIQDSMFGFFNVCVNGGKLRNDYRLNKAFLVFGAAGYFHSKTAVQGGSCDRFGRTTSSAEDTSTVIWDGLAGFEWRLDKERSQILFSVGARNDRRDNGTPFYNERALNYSASVFVSGPYSLEFIGRHRIRFQEDENVRNGITSVPWIQGFHQTAFKIAPKWVITQGIDYTTLLGFSTLYFNGALLYRFNSQTNIKLFVGQQQGGLRCANGVCRVFPAFEGARAEFTLRF